MKRILCSILLTLFVLFPNGVLADGGMTISSSSLTVEQGSSKTFTISAYNTIGDVSIESKDSSIASVNTNQWSTGMVDEKQTKTGSITVTGKSAGTTEIILNIDAATFDEEEITLTKKIIVNVTAPKSSNANLSGITVDGSGISKFNSGTTSYTLSNTDDSSITIAASAEDSKAKVSGVGTKNLTYGLNVFDIIVTAENGSKKTYTLKITRNDDRSSENSLSSLTVSPKNIDFSSGKTSYNLIVDNDVTEIKIDAKAKDSKAKVSGTGTKKLDVYTNTFNVVVTAENGSKKTYTLRITRKDENGNVGKLSSVNTLESLVVEGYDIKFDGTKDTYYLNVPRNIDKVNVIAKSTDSKATVTINNPETLQLGDNTIMIDVTAENGTTKTYKIVINRDNGIPRVTMNELLDTISKTDSDTIILDIKDDNNIVTKEVLEKLNADDKKLIINKYVNDELVYTWEINGRDIKEFKDINTLVEFYSSSDKKMNELTDYARYLYFNNNLDTSIFNSIVLKLYVEDEYNDENIYGYHYKNENLSKKYSELKYKDTFIEINNLEKGNYVITQKEMKNCIHKIVVIIEFIIIILLILSAIILNLILKKKKRRKNLKV